MKTIGQNELSVLYNNASCHKGFSISDDCAHEHPPSLPANQPITRLDGSSWLKHTITHQFVTCILFIASTRFDFSFLFGWRLCLGLGSSFNFFGCWTFFSCGCLTSFRTFFNNYNNNTDITLTREKLRCLYLTKVQAMFIKFNKSLGKRTFYTFLFLITSCQRLCNIHQNTYR